MKQIGVLVMAYGSPDEKKDIEAYYTHIRRGRKPDPERLAELEERYDRIGGSPLNKVTEEVARKLEDDLNQRAADDVRFRAYVGMKHWHPYIADTVDQMAADGIREGIAIVLTPQYSRMSVAEYHKAANERASAHGFRFAEVESWHLEPGYIAFMADRVKEALERFPEGGDVFALFTAHSLPERILQWDDPYPKQLDETAAAIAKESGIARWKFAYQSASATGEPWLGPDILDALDELHEAGEKRVLVCPVGFVSDHLEVLYDIDVEAKEKADALGMQLERTDSPNAAEEFVRMLGDVVWRHANAAVATGGSGGGLSGSPTGGPGGSGDRA